MWYVLGEGTMSREVGLGRTVSKTKRTRRLYVSVSKHSVTAEITQMVVCKAKKHWMAKGIHTDWIVDTQKQEFANLLDTG